MSRRAEAFSNGRAVAIQREKLVISRSAASPCGRHCLSIVVEEIELEEIEQGAEAADHFVKK
jgi:hypothetical protein